MYWIRTGVGRVYILDQERSRSGLYIGSVKMQIGFRYWISREVRRVYILDQERSRSGLYIGSVEE